MLARLTILLLFALPVFAQDFTPDDAMKANPARFRQTTWEHTFNGGKDDIFFIPKKQSKGWIEYDLLFPSSVSAYRMPSCELTNADTGKPAKLEWVSVSRSIMTLRAPQGERIHISCIGYEMKPWRKER